jgi:hypothetical protein
MNHHQRHMPPGANRALRCLSLLLLVLAFQRETAAMPRLFEPRTRVLDANPRGYLSAVGAPSLRFQEPAALSPADPASSAHLPDVTAAAHSTEPAGTPTLTAATPAVVDDPATGEPKPEKTTAPKNKPSPQIIPDDTRPAVHPEDFLPYFQFPSPGNGAGNLNVIVPVPREPATAAALPPSSATYTQTPK